jgi:hypothetical protein
VKRSYHTINKQGKDNEKKLAEFLSKDGQWLRLKVLAGTGAGPGGEARIVRSEVPALAITLEGQRAIPGSPRSASALFEDRPCFVTACGCVRSLLPFSVPP